MSHIPRCENEDCEKKLECFRQGQDSVLVNFKAICLPPEYKYFWKKDMPIVVKDGEDNPNNE